VTTVRSRIDHPLPQTLRSLRRAGFDDPRLFVDGDDDLKLWKQRFGLEVTCRSGPPSKVVANWILSMLELYHREPLCDRYAIFQDDLVTYANLRAYLDHTPYPDRGYLNLYTFPQNQSIAPRRAGWFEGVLLNGNSDPKRFQKGLGAVALVFSAEALRVLFTHPGLFDKSKHASYGRIKIDGGIVTAMNLQGWREYVHNPSLVQHTGEVSSREENTRRHPTATSFLGEGYDALGLLKEVQDATR
jgi:hypothetical protein